MVNQCIGDMQSFITHTQNQLIHDSCGSPSRKLFLFFTLTCHRDRSCMAVWPLSQNIKTAKLLKNKTHLFKYLNHPNQSSGENNNNNSNYTSRISH